MYCIVSSVHRSAQLQQLSFLTLHISEVKRLAAATAATAATTATTANLVNNYMWIRFCFKQCKKRPKRG